MPRATFLPAPEEEARDKEEKGRRYMMNAGNGYGIEGDTGDMIGREGTGDFTDVAQAVEEEGSSGSSDDELLEDSDEFELPEPTTFASLRNAVTKSAFTKYLKDFDKTVGKQTVTFASLPAHVIDEGNRAQLLAQGLAREDEALQHQNDMEHIELLKRRRMFEWQRHRIEHIHNNRRQLRDIQIKGTLTEELLGTYFGFSKQNLDIHLTTRVAEVLQSVGEVRRFERGAYDPNKPDWSKFEQQVEMRVVKMRGLKDKVPKGEYIILVSKWDKLAGEPMKWSSRAVPALAQFAPCTLHAEEKDTSIRSNCEVCCGWAGGTVPIAHSGDPRGFETAVNSRVFTFFPSEQTIKPYMALMFELVLIPAKRSGSPKIVGWGVMPCVDCNFAVINGKFRFPMLRGEYTTHYSHHETVRKALSHDLENWLCNVYLEIFPHPREHYGRSEFQMYSEFTSHLLNLQDYPASKELDGWPTDSRKRGYSFDLENIAQLEAQEQREKVGPFGTEASMDIPQHRKSVVGGGGKGGVIDDTNYFPYLRPAVVRQLETPTQTYWGIIRDAVFDRQRFQKQEAQKSQQEAVRRAEEQKQYRFSVHPQSAILMTSAWSTQVEYCTRAILDELSLRDPKNPKFYLNIAVLVISLLLQDFIRCCFVIVGTFMIGVPRDDITIRWYGIVTYYSIRNTTALQEVLFVFFNMLATCLLLQSMILSGALVKYMSGKTPDQLSKFVFSSALMYYFVPWLDLLIDQGKGIHHGDIMRLGDYFEYHAYGAFYGYVTFGVVYFTFAAVVFVTTFLYTMRLHLNGILQDAYWRILVVNEDNFFIPADLEVSQREFYHLLHRAERWRGASGKRRKVAVYDLTTTDPAFPKFLQKNQYIAVYELNTEDTEEYMQYRHMKVYRHFFFTFEGAILECLADEVPSGVVAAVLRMQSTFLKALTRGASSHDPMAIALGKNLKRVDSSALDSTDNNAKGHFQSRFGSPFGSPTTSKRKNMVSFK